MQKPPRTGDDSHPSTLVSLPCAQGWPLMRWASHLGCCRVPAQLPQDAAAPTGRPLSFSFFNVEILEQTPRSETCRAEPPAPGQHSGSSLHRPLPFQDLGNKSPTLRHVAPPGCMAAMSLPLLPNNKETPELIHGLKFKFLHQCTVPCPTLCLDLHPEVVHSAVGCQVSSVPFTL